MADDFDKELSRAEKLLKERLTKAGSVARDITNKAFRELVQNVEAYARAIDSITEELDTQLSFYDKIKESTRQYGDALKNQLPYIRENKDLAAKLTGIYKTNNSLADKLAQNQENLVTGQLSSQQAAKDLAKASQQQLTITLAQRDIAQEIGQVERDMVGLQGEELENLETKILALKEINEQLEEEKNTVQDITDNLQEQADSASKIDAKVGVGAKLLKGFKKIPILGDLLDIQGAEDAMRATATAGGGYFKSLGAGIKALGPSLKAALGPLALIQTAADVFKFFLDAAFEANKRVTDLSRNLQISFEEAEGIDGYFKSMKNSLETQYKLTKEIYAAQSQLSELSEASALYSKDQIDAQIQLTKEYGLQAQDAANLNKLFIVNGENALSTLDTAAQTTSEFFKQNKVLFSERKILEQASKVSGQLLVSFKGSTKELLNAVMTANKLGLSLEQTKKISDGLLNFEQSISSELEAELLTGKNLNLERARSLALQGKFAEAAEEVANQVGTIEEFQQMNVFQQEALAKAAGLTVDELSNALIKNKLIDETQKAQYDNLVKAGQQELANRMAMGEASDEEIKAANKRLDAQEKFNIAVEQAKEIFSDLVSGGALQTLADALQGLADSAFLKGYAAEGEAKRLEKDLEKDKKGTEEEKAIIKLAQNQVSLVDQLKGIAKGAAIGAAGGAAIGGVGAIPGALIGAAVYGFKGSREKRIGQEAATESEKIREKYYPNENKELEVNDFTIRTNPADTLVMAGGTQFGDETNALLKELISAVKSGGSIYMDSTKVGTALGLATYNSNVDFNS